jgi:hypothetical protein
MLPVGSVCSMREWTNIFISSEALQEKKTFENCPPLQRHLQKKVSEVFVDTPSIDHQHATSFTQHRVPRRGILVTEFEYHRSRNPPYTTVSVISIEPPMRQHPNDGLPSYEEVVTQSRPPIVANK